MKPFLLLLSLYTLLSAENSLSTLLSVDSKAGQSSTSGSFTFSYIPAGSFKMGSPASEAGRGDDENQVDVSLTKPFLMLTTEVTQGHWKEVMGSTISELISSKADSIGRGANLKNKPSAVGETQPMCYISHGDAINFCVKLTTILQASGDLTVTQSVTLPTEAQWEYASRAGTTNIFATGNTFTDKDGCFYSAMPYGVKEKGTYLERSVEVGSYAPNAWGLYDMNGNMYEWCLDWYTEKLPGGEDPAEMTKGDSRNIRGGTWNRKGTSSRNAYRYSYDPGQRTNNIGFRVIIVSE